MADKLDPVAQRELAQFLEQEQMQAKIKSNIHQLTSMCWDKCITGAPGTSLSRNEESCLTNCVHRFIDTGIYLMHEIQSKRDSQ